MNVMEPVEIPKATIKEAAERAGVSIASVSRALNNKPGISEKTRKRILDICAELNYIPNTSARELTAGHSNTIAISMGPHDFVASRYLGMLWPALSSAIRKKGQNLLPVEQDTDISQITGAILLGVEDNDARAKYLKETGVPFVSIGCSDGVFWVALMTSMVPAKQPSIYWNEDASKSLLLPRRFTVVVTNSATRVICRQWRARACR